MQNRHLQNIFGKKVGVMTSRLEEWQQRLGLPSSILHDAMEMLLMFCRKKACQISLTGKNLGLHVYC